MFNSYKKADIFYISGVIFVMIISYVGSFYHNKYIAIIPLILYWIIFIFYTSASRKIKRNKEMLNKLEQF